MLTYRNESIKSSTNVFHRCRDSGPLSPPTKHQNQATTNLHAFCAWLWPVNRRFARVNNEHKKTSTFNCSSMSGLSGSAQSRFPSLLGIFAFVGRLFSSLWRSAEISTAMAAACSAGMPSARRSYSSSPRSSRSLISTSWACSC